ncbi:MAG: VOC family protein [Sphingobium sp.]|nr:VOC family protein [Sphingobium sp.]
MEALAMLRLLAFTILMTAVPASAADEPPKGRITGIAGIFFKAKDPKALAAWYRDVLGLKLEDWGGAALIPDAPGHPPALIWSTFPADTKYFDPSKSDHMINYAVDDLGAFLKRIEAKGVKVLKRDDSDPSGRFAWIVDPEGNKLELWQPK